MNCGRDNHFASVCKIPNNRTGKHKIHHVHEEDSDDCVCHETLQYYDIR